MHPLTPNLHEMSDTELQEKIKSLNTRLVQAYRASPGVVNQIRMVIEDGWDDIIDIG